MRKLSPEQNILYKAIDEILWRDWDPINVNCNANLRDEYQSYTPSIFSLKIQGASVETIAMRLFEIETKRMDYDDGFENCKRVAEKIFNLKY